MLVNQDNIKHIETNIYNLQYIVYFMFLIFHNFYINLKYYITSNIFSK